MINKKYTELKKDYNWLLEQYKILRTKYDELEARTFKEQTEKQYIGGGY